MCQVSNTEFTLQNLIEKNINFNEISTNALYKKFRCYTTRNLLSILVTVYLNKKLVLLIKLNRL